VGGRCYDKESAYTIKVRIKISLNQRRKVFMNSQMLQHRRDKVIFFHVAFVSVSWKPAQEI
jgi:hypothetical protein